MMATVNGIEIVPDDQAQAILNQINEREEAELGALRTKYEGILSNLEPDGYAYRSAREEWKDAARAIQSKYSPMKRAVLSAGTYRTIERAIEMTAGARAVYDFIVKFAKETGSLPVIREICDGTGMRSTATVAHHMETLQKLGMVVREEGAKRYKVTTKDARCPCCGQEVKE